MVSLRPSRLAPQTLAVGLLAALAAAAFLLLTGVVAAGREMPVLLILALVLLATASCSHLALQRRHRSLTKLHELVEDSIVRPELIAELTGSTAPGVELLRRTRTLMEAATIDLVYGDTNGHLARMCIASSPGDTGDTDQLLVEDGSSAAGDWLLSRVRTQGKAVLVPSGTRDPALRQWLAARRLRDAIVVPVPQGTGTGNAVLTVSNRVGRRRYWPFRGYRRCHLEMLQALAAHLGLALQSSQLLYRLRYDATHDSLTGLANRTVLCTQLDTLLAVDPGRRAGGRGMPSRRTPLAVLLLDLNRFKEVNDTLGHHVGDALLQVVAQRLRAVLPATATVARLGGDEFAIALPTPTDPVGIARHYADAIIASLVAPVRLDDALVAAQVSIGIALGNEGMSSADLLRQADTAMYVAKSGHEQIAFYSPDLDRGRTERLALVADLQRALQRDEFVLRYQPKLRLDANGTTVAGVEALVRWQHPQLGLLAPDAFIPLAEASGLVEPLTRIVLGKALEQCRRWASEGLDLGVAVNLPARSVANPALPQAVAEMLRSSGVDASKLILEITEPSVMDDPDQSVAVLQELAALGVTLSLDDFGTGYSSLSYLRRLPIQELKIDRSFVLGLADPDTVPANTLVIRTIVNLAADLSIRVVAEGVENAQCLATLRALGVDAAQGYFIGRPMEPAALGRHLSARSQPPVDVLTVSSDLVVVGPELSSP